MMGDYHRHWHYTPPAPTPAQPNPPQEPTDIQQRLLTDYQNIRLDIASFEEILGHTDAILTERDRKELDKAVVLMKAGAKLIKRRLRVHGFHGRLKANAPATS